LSFRSHILVVAHQADVAEQLSSWVDAAGYEVSRANSFASGKARLTAGSSAGPASGRGAAPDIDLVIAEVKLGDYNGLHLALRAKSIGIPAIVIGHPDLALEREAAMLGATYLPGMPTQDELLAAVRALVGREPAAVPSSRNGVSGGDAEGPGRSQAAHLR